MFHAPFQLAGGCSTRVSKLEQFDILRARIDDDLATGTDDDALEFLIERAATVVNISRLDIVRDKTVTLTGGQPFHQITDLGRDIARIIGVRVDDRDLDLVSWPQITWSDNEALIESTNRPEQWTVLGGDLLVVHPVQAADLSVQLIYAPVIDIVDCGQFEDRSIGMVLDMAEMLLMVRTRETALLQQMMDRL